MVRKDHWGGVIGYNWGGTYRALLKGIIMFNFLKIGDGKRVFLAVFLCKLYIYFILTSVQ